MSDTTIERTELDELRTELRELRELVDRHLGAIAHDTNEHAERLAELLTVSTEARIDAGRNHAMLDTALRAISNVQLPPGFARLLGGIGGAPEQPQAAGQ